MGIPVFTSPSSTDYSTCNLHTTNCVTCAHFNYEDRICEYCGHDIRELHSPVCSKSRVFKIYDTCNANRMFASAKVIL
jgi:hypothetical protein